MIILGIDFGRSKTGTAYVNTDINIPFPLKLIEETNARKVKRAILDIIEEKKIELIIFGLPLSSEGLESEWCKEIQRFTQFLLTSIDIEVKFVNEFATSKEADEILKGKSKRVKKNSHDLISAVLILETFLREEEVKKRKVSEQ